MIIYRSLRTFIRELTRNYNFPRPIVSQIATILNSVIEKKDGFISVKKYFIHILCIVVKAPYTLLPEIFFLMASQRMSFPLLVKFEKCKCAVLRRVRLIDEIG